MTLAYNNIWRAVNEIAYNMWRAVNTVTLAYNNMWRAVNEITYNNMWRAALLSRSSLLFQNFLPFSAPNLSCL